MTKVASLEIELFAGIARLQRDMDEARRVVNKAGGDIDRMVGRMNQVLGTIGVGVSLTGLAMLTKQLLSGVDALNDIKDATGAAIENLSAFEQVIKRNGGRMETATAMLVKFNKVLLEAKPGDEASQVLKSLNMDIERLKRMDPAEALHEMSKAFVKYADDGNKARNMQVLFKTSIAEAGPVLKDLAEKQKLVGKVTTEQAQEVERFNKIIFGLKQDAEDAARSGLLVLIQAIKDLGTAAKENNPYILVLMGTLAGGAAAAGVLGLVAGIKALAGGILALGAALMANPVVLLLLGIGVAAGAMVGVVKAQAATAEGIQEAIRGLETANERSAEMLKNAEAAGRVAGAENIRKVMAERLAQIKQLRGELDAMKGIKSELAGTGDFARADRAMGAGAASMATPTDPAAAKAAAQEYQNLLNRIKERIDLQKAEKAAGRELNEQEKFAAKIQQEIATAKHKLSPIQQAAIDKLLQESAALFDANTQRERQIRLMQAIADFHQENADDTTKAFLEASQTRDRAALALQAEKEGLEDSKRLLDAEAASLGLTSTQRSVYLEQLKIQIKLERDLEALRNDSNYDPGQRGLRESKLRETAEMAKQLVAQRGELEKFNEIWGTVEKTAHDVWTNIWEGGSNVFKRLGQTLKAALLDLLYQMTVKKWLINIGANITGSGNAAANILGGGGGNILSSLSSLGSIGSSVAGMFGSGGLGSSLLGGGSVAGALFGTGGGASAFATSAGALEAGVLVEGIGGTAGALSGVGSALAAIPGWGWAAMAALAILGMSQKKGGPKQDGKFGTLFSGISSGGLNSVAGQTAGGMQGQFDSLMKALGMTNSVKFGVGISTDPKGDSPSFLDITATGQGGLSELLYHSLNRNVGRSEEDMKQALIEGSAKAMLGALQSLSGLSAGRKFETVTGSRTVTQMGGADVAFEYIEQFTEIIETGVDETARAAAEAASQIPKSIRDMLRGKDVDALSAEQAQALIDQIAAVVAGVNGFREAMKVLPFENLKNLSFDAAAALIAANGGLQQFTANLSSYYDNFYSEEEKRLNVAGQIAAKVSAAGLSIDAAGVLSATRDQFRGLVESLEPGSDLWNALISVNGAFASLTKTVESTARTAEDIAAERYGIETQILQMLGQTATLRHRELEQLDPSNRAMQKRLYYLQDEQARLERIKSIAGRVTGVAKDFLAPADYQAFLVQKIRDRLAQAHIDVTPAQVMAATPDIVRQMFMTFMDLGNLDAQEALLDAVDAFKELKPAAFEAAESVEEIAKRLQDLGKGIFEFVRTLRADRAGTAAPWARVEGTRSNYVQDLALARANDMDALGRISQSAQDYIEAAKAYGASGPSTQAVIDQVIADLATLPAVKSYEQQMLDVLGQINTSTGQVPSWLSTVTGAINALPPSLASAIADRFDSIDLNGDGITLAEMQTALAGKATDSQLQTIFNLLDADGDGTISKLEALAAKGDQANDLASRILARLEQNSILSYSKAEVQKVYGDIEYNTRRAADLLDVIRAGNGFAAPTTTPPINTGAGSDAGAVVGGGTTTGGSDADRFAQELALYEQLKASGQSIYQAAAGFGWDTATVDAWLARTGLPAFAVGTNFVPRDMLAMIHQGEAIVPKAYNPAAGGGWSDAAITTMLERIERAIREEMRGLREITAEGARQSISVQGEIRDNTEGLSKAVDLAKIKPVAV